MFHPLDDFYGLSPIQVASRRVDLWNAGESWNVSMFQNSCRPSGALVAKDGMTIPGEQLRRLEDQLRTKYSGPVNSYLPMILERMSRGEIVTEYLATHVMPLDEAPHGYDIFKNKEDNCEKVVLTP